MAVFGQKAPEAVETESWKVWFDSQLPRGLTLEEYRQRVLLVSEVGSLTDLEQGDMAAYNNFDFVPEKESTKTGASDRSERNPFRFNLRIFKESLAPFWEDMPDTAVIYTLKFPSKLSPINYQLMWKALSRSVVTGRVFTSTSLVDEDTGESNPPMDLTCLAGLVVHYGRNKGHGNVEVWCLTQTEHTDRLMENIQAILPAGDYAYEVQTRSKSNVIGGNQQVRDRSGAPIMRASAPPSFQRKEGVRSAFSPYEAVPSTAVRVFEKSLVGRAAGAPPSSATVETVTVAEATRRSGRGGGGRRRHG